ncbi:MAG: pyruvate kinase, partial [Proteobacteria bacterium]|nr:pyruvate kinase [Pseudomonadota bacterium]
MSSHRRTKIVVSLGPSTDRAKTMSALIEQGIDVARLNMSHGTRDDHRRRAQLVRDSAAQQGRAVALLVDLQGPKIRIGGFADGPVQLRNGKRFVIDTALNDRAGTEDGVGTSYADLVNDVDTGDRLLLDDGNIVLQVDKIEGTVISTRVIVGGELSDSKGINKLGGGLSASALTEKDHEDIQFAAEIGADYLGVSFVRHGGDVETARMLLRSVGSNAHVVSKIERREALDKIEEIIAASDVIMVARGDLGVEIGDAEVPGVQKRLISESRAQNTVVITATQMMQSMVSSPQPTRAEVSDVSNAVLDGTDAVMLSAESAIGRHPVKV